MPKWNRHSAGGLPDDPFNSGKLEKRNFAASIAYKDVVVGEYLDAGKPTDACQVSIQARIGSVLSIVRWNVPGPSVCARTAFIEGMV